MFLLAFIEIFAVFSRNLPPSRYEFLHVCHELIGPFLKLPGFLLVVVMLLTHALIDVAL